MYRAPSLARNEMAGARYNPDAVVAVGVPFGHTRLQWILPHGGTVVVDGAARRVTADYS
jgi:muramoyltetrapeptide carboxypeptidase LdcA involved in peptidoglycan recycling